MKKEPLEIKQKKLILLIIPRYNMTNKVNYNYYMPIGLGYISSVMKKQGYEVDCLNLNHCNGIIEEIVSKELNNKNYDFVCTGNNALGYFVTKKIIEAVKKHNSKPQFILGGPIITSEPDFMFNLLKPDYAVIGEGEETIINLLECLEKGVDLKKVKGIVYREKNGGVVFTEKREPIKNLDSITFPDFESFGFEKQLDNMVCNDYYFTNVQDYPRTYPILCSRSCPYHCTFCYHDAVYRTRSIDNVMKEINFAVKKYKINILLIFDECFAVDKKRLIEFCERIKKLKEEIDWDLKWTCQLMVKDATLEILKIMKDAGCDTISYGFESYSPIVLKSMRKFITPEKINQAFNETLKAKIGIQANFIFGDIAETKETAHETLEYWKKNCNGQIGLGFIQPYPGSELYKHCLKKGIIKDKLNFIENELATGLWLNMTDRMSDKEIEDLKKEILNSMSKYCKYITPMSIKKMNSDRYEVKVKCPFCQNINNYKNCRIKNKWTYGFYVVCRNCKMRFFVVSLIQKIAYKHYSKVRALRDWQKRLIKKIKRRNL